MIVPSTSVQCAGYICIEFTIDSAYYLTETPLAIYSVQYLGKIILVDLYTTNCILRD